MVQRFLYIEALIDKTHFSLEPKVAVGEFYRFTSPSNVTQLLCSDITVENILSPACRIKLKSEGKKSSIT